jgi:hypothetical protein
MKRSIVAAALSAALVLTSGLAFAQKGQGGPKGPKTPKVGQTTPKTTVGGPKLQTHAAQGPKVKSAAATTKVHGPKASTAAKAHGKPKATTTVAATKTKGPDNGRKTSTTTEAGTTLTLSPVQQKLLKNTNLASKLERRLPGTTNVIAAAEGFRNLGQFVAAVNVSNNLGIPFADLKTRMVDDGMSLGQAIQAERNRVDVTTEVRRAERDARIVIAEADEAMKKKVTKAKKVKTHDGR